MNLKKFAMLLLTVLVVSGFSAKQVSASAKDGVVPTPAATASAATKSAVKEKKVTAKKDTKKKETTKKETTKKETTKKAAVKKKAAYTKTELRLMASIINCEAGAESYQGKLAVGIVIMNRIHSKSFPSTLRKVIYQKYQFSPVRNGSLNKRLRQYDAGKTGSKQWKDCISAAKKVLNGQSEIIVKGKTKSLRGYYFFSVKLPGAKLKLGGHKFK